MNFFSQSHSLKKGRLSGASKVSCWKHSTQANSKSMASIKKSFYSRQSWIFPLSNAQKKVQKLFEIMEICPKICSLKDAPLSRPFSVSVRFRNCTCIKTSFRLKNHHATSSIQARCVCRIFVNQMRAKKMYLICLLLLWQLR